MAIALAHTETRAVKMIKADWYKITALETHCWAGLVETVIPDYFASIYPATKAATNTKKTASNARRLGI